MAKKNESKKLVKGVSKELKHIMELEDLLCTFLSLDDEGKINELLGKIKNKKGADAWFNKVIKNTVHLIGEDNFKEEFETYVNTNRASLTDLVVNYDESVTEQVLKGFLNNTEAKNDDVDKEPKKEEPKKEEKPETKEKEEPKAEKVKEDKKKDSEEKVKTRTSGDEIRKICPKELYNRLPKAILDFPIGDDDTLDEEMITTVKPFVDAYMEIANLDKLEELAKEIDDKKLKLYTPGKSVFELFMAKGFENAFEEDIEELQKLISEDDIQLIEMFASDLGIEVMTDVARAGALVKAENEEEEIPGEEIEKIIKEQMGELKKQYKDVVKALRTPILTNEKDFTIKLLDKEIEVKGSKYDDEILSNAREAIIEAFNLVGSGAAMLDYSVDLVIEAMEDNNNEWSEECYMKVFDKILSSPKKPFTLKFVKSLAI